MKQKCKNIAIPLCMVLLLGVSCENPLGTDNRDHIRGNGTVYLTIEGTFDDSPARTIFPDNPVFSSYRLSFESLDSQEPKPDMEISVSEGERTIHAIDLEPGNWKITVYGRIAVNSEEKEVAQGSSDTLHVIADENISVTVILRSKIPDTGTGIFSWSITIPQGIAAGAYSVSLSEWGSETNKALDRKGVIDTESVGSVISGSEEIDAGYYLLQVTIGDDRKQYLSVDIVHILTDRTSRFDYTVVASDFVPVIYLSGTVRLDVTINKMPGPQPVISEVWAYSAANEKIGVAVVTNNTWEMSLIEMQQETDLYFTVVCTIPGSDDTFEVKNNTVYPVSHSDISGIDIRDTFPVIVLSGTLVPKGITSTDQWKVQGYTDINAISQSYIMDTPAQCDTTGNWSKIVPAFAVGTEVYFSIEDPTGIYRRTNLSATKVHDTNVSGIIITGYFTPPEKIKVTGTLPGMAGFDNWTNPELFLSKGNTKFTYTYTHNELGSMSYGIQFLANFDSQNNTSWDASSDSIVTYNYAGVAKPSEAALGQLDFWGGTNEAITWFNYSSQFPIKTLKFTMDFSGEMYFSTGKPTLLIERRSEVRIVKPVDSFIMGSPPTEEGRNGPSGLSSETQHPVTFSHDYWMMETEVDQKTYKELVPSYTNSDCANDRYPAVYISWREAVAFANKLSEKDGLNPVYTITDAKVSPDWQKNGWRLPTEAEWEYAARGGASTPFGIGNGTTLSTDQANYGNNIGHIVDVYTYSVNTFGLYNMHGNAWEFCWDYYADYTVSQTPLIDPRGYETPEGGWENGRGNGNDGKTGTDDKGLRIIRGGSYFCSSRYLRSAHRGTIGETEKKYNDIGFRLVRIVE